MAIRETLITIERIMTENRGIAVKEEANRTSEFDLTTPYNRKERILQSCSSEPSRQTSFERSVTKVFRGKKRTLNDTINKLKGNGDLHENGSKTEASCSKAPKCTWLLVGEDGRILLKADAKTEKKNNYFIVSHPNTSAMSSNLDHNNKTENFETTKNLWASKHRPKDGDEDATALDLSSRSLIPEKQSSTSSRRLLSDFTVQNIITSAPSNSTIAPKNVASAFKLVRASSAPKHDVIDDTVPHFEANNLTEASQVIVRPKILPITRNFSSQFHLATTSPTCSPSSPHGNKPSLATTKLPSLTDSAYGSSPDDGVGRSLPFFSSLEATVRPNNLSPIATMSNSALLNFISPESVYSRSPCDVTKPKSTPRFNSEPLKVTSSPKDRIFILRFL